MKSVTPQVCGTAATAAATPAAYAAAAAAPAAVLARPPLARTGGTLSAYACRFSWVLGPETHFDEHPKQELVDVKQELVDVDFASV